MIHDRDQLADALEEALVGLRSEQPDLDEGAAVSLAAAYQKNIREGRYDDEYGGLRSLISHAATSGHEVLYQALLKVINRMKTGEFLIEVVDVTES